jgi:hypothetical protein
LSAFMFVTTCNRPRLTDAKAAQKIIDRYCFDWDLGVAVEPDPDSEQEYLVVSGGGWPAAWKIPTDVPPDDFRPDYEETSVDGFEELIKELATCLAEPLTVQSVGTVDGQFPLSACEWHVKPGVISVDVNGFKYVDAEPECQVACQCSAVA